MRFINKLSIIVVVGLFQPFSPLWAADAAGAFRPMVDKTCGYLKQATAAYQQGNRPAAEIAGINAYFKAYDADIEIPVRTTLGNQHTFEMEQQFKGFIDALKVPGEVAKVQKMEQDLCAAVTADAVALTKEKVLPKQPNS